MMLSLGFNHQLHIRQKVISVSDIPNLKIIYLSDFHFNRFSNGLMKVLVAHIQKLAPHYILLGGDYADTLKGLDIFQQFLKMITPVCNHIFAVLGNHEKWLGNAKVKNCLLNHNVIMVDEEPYTSFEFGRPISIYGSWNSKTKPAHFNILCLHKPIAPHWPTDRFQLILAGHLHGSQVVWWQNKHILYPGRLIYKWNRLEVISSNYNYIISRGISDTIPIRFNCPWEMIYIQNLNSKI